MAMSSVASHSHSGGRDSPMSWTQLSDQRMVSDTVGNCVFTSNILSFSLSFFLSLLLPFQPKYDKPPGYCCLLLPLIPNISVPHHLKAHGRPMPIDPRVVNHLSDNGAKSDPDHVSGPVIHPRFHPIPLIRNS